MIPMNDIREDLECRFEKLLAGVEGEVEKHPGIKCDFWNGYKDGMNHILNLTDRDMERVARGKVSDLIVKGKGSEYDASAYMRGWDASLLELKKRYERHIRRMYL